MQFGACVNVYLSRGDIKYLWEVHNPVHAAIDSRRIPKGVFIATGFCCTDRWSYGPYYLFSEDGRTQKAWWVEDGHRLPIQQRQAWLVLCFVRVLGLVPRRAALISQRWMMVYDWKELLANTSLSTRSTGGEYKYYCSMTTRCLSALCRRCLSVFSSSQISPVTKIDCGWIPRGAVGGSREWQRHLVSVHVIENFTNDWRFWSLRKVMGNHLFGWPESVWVRHY